MKRPSTITLALLTALACAGDDDRAPATPELPPGFWTELPNAPGAAPPRLDGLGYAAGYERADSDLPGAHTLDAERVAPGYDLYSSGHAAAAFLMDRAGEVVHRWALPHARIADAPTLDHPSQFGWRRVRLLPDGSLVALHDGIMLVKVDRDSRLQWWFGERAHHDIDLAPDGSIVTLTRRVADVPEITERAPILEEFVTFLGPDGAKRAQVSLVDAFRDTPWFEGLREASAEGSGRVEIEIDGRSALDLFHANSVHVLDGRFAERDPAFAEGNVLLCLRELNALAILNPRAGRIVWFRLGDWLAPHDPRMTDTGTMTLFDNLGGPGGTSRMLEIDPFGTRVLATLPRAGGVALRSPVCGAARRLPNGNTLLTESTGGRALEFAPDGDVVWVFRSPHRTGPEDGWTAVLFEVERIAGQDVADWLTPASSPR